MHLPSSSQGFHAHCAINGALLPRETPYSGSQKRKYPSEKSLQEMGSVSGEWNPEEDAALLALVAAEGPGDWRVKSVALGAACGFRSPTALRKRYHRLQPAETTGSGEVLATTSVAAGHIPAASAATAFRFSGGNLPAAGGVLGASPLEPLRSVPGVTPAAPMGCVAPVGSVGPKPDMLSALVEQAAAEEDALVEQAAADEPTTADQKAQKRMVNNGQYTDEDDKALQRVVSMFALEGATSTPVWDQRVEAFNAERKSDRSKGALRQRWTVLKSQGWAALPGGQRRASPAPWTAEDDECLRQMVVESERETEWVAKTAQFNAARQAANPSCAARTPHSVRYRWLKMKENPSSRSERANAGSQVESSDSKQASKGHQQASKAHQKLRREMNAINKDVAVLRDAPEGHKEADYLQEHIVAQVAQLVQAVENVHTLWLLAQKDGSVDAQAMCVKETCSELTEKAKTVRAAIAAAFEQGDKLADTRDKLADTSRPKKKFKQIRNANQHAQAGIARKVLNAWLAQEDRPPTDNKYSHVARSQKQKTEMIRLVNAALIEQGLLPAYTQSNLNNWFKNLSYKQALISQGRLPPSWVRVDKRTETRYLSGPLTKEPQTLKGGEGREKPGTHDAASARRYIKRLTALAETQDQTMAHALGQDKFTAQQLEHGSETAGVQNTQYHQYAEHADAVLKGYVDSEKPQLPDPYSKTARCDPPYPPVLDSTSQQSASFWLRGKNR